MACIEELARAVRETLEDNMNAWLLSSNVALLVLLISFTARTRGVTLSRYYSKHGTQPKHYTIITLVPYEALAAFVCFGIPQLLWAGSVIQEAVNAGAWETRNLKSVWGWAFLGYFFIIDCFERIHFRHRSLQRFYKLKVTRALKGMVAEATQEVIADQKVAVDEESAEVQPAEKTTIYARLRTLRAVFTTVPDPTAVHVLTQFHMFAFIKAFFTVSFLAHTMMFVTWGAQPIDKLFDMEAGFAVPFGIVFGRREVDFAAVNGREGQLRL